MLETRHTAFVHDTQVDPSGKFIATCSSDRRIKIYRKEQDTFCEFCELGDHTGPLKRCCWSHPAFGLLVATASDRVIHLYSLDVTQKQLQERHQIKSQTRIITDIAFAPRHFGIRVAYSTDDGHVFLNDLQKEVARIDPTAQPIAAPTANMTFVRNYVSSISFCPSLTESAMQLVCGMQQGEVFIHRFTPPEISSSSRKGFVIVPLKTEDGKEIVLKHNSPISCVSWAPSVGRRFHLVAFGSSEGVTLVKLSRFSSRDTGSNNALAGSVDGKSSLAAQSVEHYSVQVFDVSSPQIDAKSLAWNRSATVLAVAGNDGRPPVKIYQKDVTEFASWICSPTI